jgi:hypothetical protein
MSDVWFCSSRQHDVTALDKDLINRASGLAHPEPQAGSVKGKAGGVGDLGCEPLRSVVAASGGPSSTSSSGMSPRSHLACDLRDQPARRDTIPPHQD